MVVDAGASQRFAESVAVNMYRLDNAARTWGVEITEIRPHHAVARMTVREDMLNSHGVCHGAMLFALADTAFAYASNSENCATLASSCSITFTEAVPSGVILTARAEKRSRGRRTGVYDVTVTNGEGRVVALFRGNSYEVPGDSVPGLDKESQTDND
ncbi:MAG: hydroxyphenylacetyl-CoA thioesterase PaaI [Rhodospirillales bacterium]|nr:MAG: hydroxyphenylacetyl-CoA thioesterase PaaI [Rhodospirillales bacterium]